MTNRVLSEEVEDELIPLHHIMQVVRSCIPLRKRTEAATITTAQQQHQQQHQEECSSEDDPPSTSEEVKSKKQKSTSVSSFQFTKETKTLIQDSIKEFMYLILIKTIQDKKSVSRNSSVITSDDLIQSLDSLEFNSYTNILKMFINDYRNEQE